MKIVVFQENILKKLNIAAKALPMKNINIPSLNNFLLTARDGEIEITASNLETTIKTKAQGKIEENGQVLINAKTLLAFLAPLTGEKITITKEGQGVKIEGSATKITLKTEKAEDFPKISAGKKEKRVKIPRKTLEETVKSVCFAASTDEARGVLSGVCFKSEEEKLNIAATDGFRLSLLSKNKKTANKNLAFILSAKTAGDIFSILKEEGGEEIDLELVEGEKQAVFSTAETQIISRLLEGSFPNIRKIIPMEASTTIDLNREELLKAVKLASILAREASNIVKLKNNENGFFLYASSPQTGENQTKLDVKISGEKEINIAFNFRFLLDFLNSSEEEEVVFKTSGALSPGVFQFPKKPEFLHIIMPVRLQEGENS